MYLSDTKGHRKYECIDCPVVLDLVTYFDHQQRFIKDGTVEEDKAQKFRMLPFWQQAV
jgi:hypothetical protein